MTDAPAPAEPAPAEVAPEPPPTSTGTTTSEAPRGGAIWTIGGVIVLIGAIALVVSAFLHWEDAGGDTAKGTDVPLEFLIDNETDSGSPSILVALGAAAALAAAGALVRSARLVALIGGALGVVVAVLYGIQVDSGLPAGIGMFDFISTGTYVALAGGIVVLVGSLLPRSSSA